MKLAHERDRWQHTSALMSLMQNLQCTKSSDQLPPSFFNPTIPKSKPQPLPPGEGVAIARAIFCPGSLRT